MNVKIATKNKSKVNNKILNQKNKDKKKKTINLY